MYILIPFLSFFACENKCMAQRSRRGGNIAVKHAFSAMLLAFVDLLLYLKKEMF